jgi:arginine deiminase
LRTDHAAATQENQVLRLKLEHSEREHESTRREHETLQRGLERAETEVEHLRGLTTQQAETAQNLTEEIKGLTIALHHEQNQRLELASPSKDEDEERNETTESAGFLRRVFKRKPKRKRGKFARVGPA